MLVPTPAVLDQVREVMKAARALMGALNKLEESEEIRAALATADRRSKATGHGPLTSRRMEGITANIRGVLQARRQQ
jgi:hypothetical protein